jgi:hypothetical protein
MACHCSETLEGCYQTWLHPGKVRIQSIYEKCVSPCYEMKFLHVHVKKAMSVILKAHLS